MNANTQPQAMNAQQLAAALTVHRTTIWRLLQAKRIPQPVRLGYRTLRWPPEVVAQILREIGPQEVQR
ncbi:MAG: AlpA family phage regulatory protein [Rubrivivax sp.]|nr:AlpA family phage regulatory protein [Rubrivivax sp.]